MSITISKFDDQSRGYYDGGLIKERKGVYFESEVKGISNLFFMSHTFSEEGGLVEEHAHKGFEVVTYVLEGEIEYNISESEEWVPLKAGDMQVIKAGNGMAHSEKYKPGAKTIQVWLDPGFRRSLQRPAAQTDYEAADFEKEEFEGMERIDFCGDESPVWFSSPMQMDRFDFGKGSFKLPIPKNHILTAVVLGGEVTVDEETLSEGDLIRVQSGSSFEFESGSNGSLFVVVVPGEPGYRTYTDQMQMSS